MAQQLYRVVESTQQGSSQVQLDIGLAWKPEKAAKDELRAMKIREPNRWLSIQKKP